MIFTLRLLKLLLFKKVIGPHGSLLLQYENMYLYWQVEETERIVVNTPGYLKNLTEILSTEPKRNIANYMLWRATRASIGFMNKAARDVIEEYARNITGKTETTPR